jgi:hypothetical protein
VGHVFDVLVVQHERWKLHEISPSKHMISLCKKKWENWDCIGVRSKGRISPCKTRRMDVPSLDYQGIELI